MLKEIDEGKTELECTPGALLFAPSSYCNFKCKFCSQKELLHKPIRCTEVVTNQAMSLLPNLVALIMGGGEPILQPQLERVYRASGYLSSSFEGITRIKRHTR